MNEKASKDKKVDKAVDMTFPASDPPARGKPKEQIEQARQPRKRP
jgi:hypothetical protein